MCMTVFSKSGKAHSVYSFNLSPAKVKADRRQVVPSVCFECGEAMHQDSREDLGVYVAVTYSCRNGHSRVIYQEATR